MQATKKNPRTRLRVPGENSERVGRQFSSGLNSPPYAARLRERTATAELRANAWGTSANGLNVCVWVLAGTKAWEWARDWSNTPRLFLLVPTDREPEEFDWRCVSERADTVLLSQCGELSPEDEHRIAAALIRDGVRRVLALRRFGPVQHYVRGSR